MSEYQGHLEDGSSVQKHSAGPAYPFVVQVVERGGKDGGRAKVYQIIGPGISTAGLVVETEYGDIVDSIAEHLRKLATDEDAWSFELEQNLKAGDVRIASLESALKAWVPAVYKERRKFSELTQSERIEVLLWLAQRRGRTPKGSLPFRKTFMQNLWATLRPYT